MTKKYHSILSLILVFAGLISCGSASAYTVFPSKDNAELLEWEYTADYFKSGAPEAAKWGDSYENDNVWEVVYRDENGDDIATKYTAALGNTQMYIGDVENNKGNLGFIYFNNPEESANKPYLETGHGNSFNLVWTSPIDGAVKVDMTGLSRWGKTYDTYFTMLSNGKELGDITYGAKGENVGKRVSKILKVKKGDTITTKVYLDDENVNGAVVEMKVSQIRTAITNDDDYNKTWNAISDYKSAGNPKKSSWDDTYGNSNVWEISYYDLNTNAESTATVDDGKWKNPFNTDPDTKCYMYVDGTVFYGETGGLELGAQGRVNWTAKEDGTVVANMTGVCRWGNTAQGVKFLILKNGTEVENFTVAGMLNSKTIEKKITVSRGDVISFAAQTMTGREGYRIDANVEARHGVQITENPTITVKDAEGEPISAPVEGGTIDVSLPVYNANTEKIGAVVFAALYGADNELIELKKIDCGQIDPETTYTAADSITVTTVPARICIYVWDSEVGMKPYYSGSTKSF